MFSPGPASKEKVDDGIYALEHAHGSIMSALEVEISRGSYLGEILTNLIQIWVCVVVYVTVDAAVQLIFSDKTMCRNGFLR